jgi:hypothetical protein
MEFYVTVSPKTQIIFDIILNEPSHGQKMVKIIHAMMFTSMLAISVNKLTDHQ